MFLVKPGLTAAPFEARPFFAVIVDPRGNKAKAPCIDMLPQTPL